jgi:hypothetical protein
MRTAVKIAPRNEASLPAKPAARAHDTVGGPVGELYDRLQSRIVPVMQVPPVTRAPALEQISRVAGFVMLGTCYLAVLAWFLA